MTIFLILPASIFLAQQPSPTNKFRFAFRPFVCHIRLSCEENINFAIEDINQQLSQIKWQEERMFSSFNGLLIIVWRNRTGCI